MEIFVIGAIFMIVSFGGIVGAVFAQKKYEEMLPITHCGLILLMFFGGVNNGLNFGVWLICVIVIVGYFICILYIIKNKNFDRVKKYIFTDCFWIFLFVYLLIYICNIGKAVHYWDEYVCWATRVKDMCRLDTLYTSSLSHTDATAYPPATALIQYLYQKLQYVIVGEKKFVPWYLFVSYQVFMISFLIPLLGQVKAKKKNIKYFILIILILTLPMEYYTNAYDTIMVDQLLGVMLGYCFVLLLNRKGGIFELITFTLCQITIALTKDVAVFFCIVMWLCWVIDIMVEEYYKNKKWICLNMIWNLVGVAFFAFVQFVWNKSLVGEEILSTDSHSLISQHSSRMSISIFFEAVLGKVGDYRLSTFLNFCRAFFVCDRERSYFDIGCYYTSNFKIENFNFNVSYFALLLFFTIVFVHFSKGYVKKYEKKRQQCLIAALYLLIMGYLGIVLLTNMFLFSEVEAVGLVAYDRYISMVFLMVAYILISEWIKIKWDKNSNLSLYLLLALCLLIPGESLIQFLDRQNVYDSQTVESSYVIDVGQIEKAIGDNYSKICYMNLDEDASTLMYYKLKYGLNTNQISNMKGAENWLILKEKRDEILEKYDYIVIYNNTNRFRRSIDAETMNATNGDFDLYKIENMKLIRIL